MIATQPVRDRGASSPETTIQIDSSKIDPSRIQIVEIESEKGTIRRDCYNLGDEIRMLRLKDGEVQLRTVGWDRSKDLDPAVGLEWEGTGLLKEEVGEIRIFEWPTCELVTIYR